METIMSVGPAPNTSGNAFVGPEDCTAGCGKDSNSSTGTQDGNTFWPLMPDVCPAPPDMQDGGNDSGSSCPNPNG